MDGLYKNSNNVNVLQHIIFKGSRYNWYNDNTLFRGRKSIGIGRNEKMHLKNNDELQVLY